MCAMLALTGCGSEKSGTADRMRLTVTLKNGLTGDERAAVEKVARDLPGALRVSFEDKQAAYGRAREKLKDQPDLLASIEPDSMPESFLVSLPAGRQAEAGTAVMRGVPGVDFAVMSAESIHDEYAAVGIIIWLKRDVTDRQRDTMEKDLRAMSSVKWVTYESRDRAYLRLCNLGGQPYPLAKMIDKEYLAASFRLEVSVRLAPKGAFVSWRDRPGVDSFRIVPTSALL
jgi:cell division protein FtsX